MSHRLSRAVRMSAACAAVAALTGCATQTVSGTPSAAAGSGKHAEQAPSGGVGVQVPDVTDGADQSAAIRLSGLLGAGLATAHTAHVTLDVRSVGPDVRAVGDEVLKDGRGTALDLTESIDGIGKLRVVQVGARTYVNLPTVLRTGGKPWALVTANSANPTARGLSSSLGSRQSSASIDSIVDIVSAADSVKQTGKPLTHGMPSTRYELTVDPGKLPTGYPGKQDLVGAGVDELRVQIRIDSQGRPVLLIDTFTLRGQQIVTQLDLTDYNTPVHIVAPPASQVSN